MSTTVTYKGNTLATVSNNTKTLKTAGKYMEGDVILTDTSSTIVVSETLDTNGGIIKTITTTDEVNLQTKTITPTSSIQTVNPDTGYDGFSQVIVNAGGSSSDFIITITYNTTTQKWEPDCTWAELSAANTAGKTIIVNATDPNDSYEPTADTTGFFDNDNYFEYKVNWFDFNQSLGLDGWVIHDIYEFSSSELTLSQRDSFTETPYLITKNITTNGTYNASSDNAQGYSSVTVNVPTGSTINNQNKTVTPTESQQSITADSGYTGLGTVTVGAISSTYVGSGIDRRDSDDLTASGATISVPAGYYAAAASKSVASGSATGPSSLSASSATITTGTNTITLTKTSVTTTPTVSAGYVSSATASTATVALTASVTVNPTLTVSGATVTAPAGYYSDAASASVSSMTLPTSAASSATSGYTSKATIGRSTSAQYINIPPGYNSAGAYYVISATPNGSVTAPSSISGTTATISTGSGTLTLTKTVSVTPNVTTAGYISSGTAGNSSVSLTANVTINPTPTASGATVTIPAGYYSSQTTKAVSSGSATAPSTISGTAASVSTGTNTLTLTKTVSVTPTVSAGYVSAGTAGNASISLTASVTTKAAATYYATTSDQTISASQYLTGAQTIKALSQTNLSAANIKAGTTISINNGNANVWSVAGTYTSDATAAATDIVSGETAYVNGRKVEGSLIVQNYYTGSSTPSSSLGNNGDIYFQS